MTTFISFFIVLLYYRSEKVNYVFLVLLPIWTNKNYKQEKKYFFMRIIKPLTPVFFIKMITSLVMLLVSVFRETKIIIPCPVYNLTVIFDMLITIFSKLLMCLRENG